MNLFIYYLFVYVIEAIILWLYCNRLFTPKKSTILSLLITIGMFLLLIPVAILGNPAINTILSCIIYLCCITLNYNSKFTSALFHALALTIIMALSEGLIAAAIPHIKIYSYREGNIYNDSELTFVILSKSIYLFISQLTARIFTKNTFDDETNSARKSTLMLYLIPAVSTIIAVSLGFICTTSILSYTNNVIIFICLILLLAINILTFYLQQDIAQKNSEYARLQIELQKETDTVEYYKYLQENDEKQHILIHDIKNHLNTINHLNDGKHIEEISEYISNILDSEALRKSKQYCNIDILNIIISRYAELCDKSGINFEADIRSDTLGYLPAEDYTSIFCNLLDNAIESAKTCDNPYIDCNVSLIRGGNADLISIANSCSSSPLGDDGKVHSAKSDKHFHGYGLKSIRRIAQKYNGLLNYAYSDEKQEFRVVVMIEHPQ